ncbi:hypothetical protein [Pedobacter sp. N23S346]|uniref:phosphoribosyltransferase-like protein n=1 Tax=Pedobacter sp. N23S346 TaxID=3402750 RepID=UPI003ACAF81A
MDLNNIDKSNSTFWSIGNEPTQAVNNLQADYITYHLKLLYLLSDKVLASSSFFFESEKTRMVTDNLLELFENGEILYFIDEDLENFREHGLKKINKSPSSLTAYNNKDQVLRLSKQMDEKFILLRRPKLSISDKIVELWIQELESFELGTIGHYIHSLPISPSDKTEIKINLVQFGQSRKKDFVWEYLHPLLTRLRVSKEFKFIVRRKLSMLYSIATTQVLGLSIDNSNFFNTTQVSANLKFDTGLFDECLNLIGLRKAINMLSLQDVMKLKYSEPFIYFKEFYFLLIEASAYKADNAKKALPLFHEVDKFLANGKIDVTKFVKAFGLLCKRLNLSKQHYKKPLELIISKYEAFNKATINNFIELVNEYSVDKKKVVIQVVAQYEEINILNAKEYVLKNETAIKKTIINNFRIPETDTPGGYQQMLERTIRWFENFKRSEFDIALLIYKNIRYYSEGDIDELLDKMAMALRKLFQNDLSKVMFSGLGDSSAGSGEQFLYRLNQRLRLPQQNFPKDFRSSIGNHDAIVFIDDIIGSGNQATRYYKKKLADVKLTKYYFSLLAYENGIKKIREETGFEKVITLSLMNESHMAFSPESEIFPKHLITKLRIIAELYGQKLYPLGPLGYDDSQALIVFAHNTPNNTLPIIWASDNNEKSIEYPWNPLFERKKN